LCAAVILQTYKAQLIRVGLWHLAMLLPCGAVAAEDATTTDFKHLDMIAAERRKAVAPPIRPRCSAGTTDEIVVCGRDRGEDQRIPPSSETDPNSPQALRTGELKPPDFVPKYHGPVIARGCFIPPCPKPPVYYFDIAALPKAAEGSDADKIAKGEMRAR
jgi:hypothetical protein